MSEEKKQILMVHNYYQFAGGEDVVFQNEANLLQSYGHKIFYYTRNNSEIKKFGIYTRCKMAFETLFSFKTYFEIKRTISNEKIDIVHVHNTLPLISYSVYYAAHKCGVPVVQTVHNFRYICPNGCLYRSNEVCDLCHRKGYRYAVRYKCYRDSKPQSALVAFMLWFHKKIGSYKKADAFIALTDFNKEILSDVLPKEKIYIKPNFTSLPDRITGVPYKNYYVYAGRLEREKGISVLVRAFQHLPDRHLIVIGSGLMEDSLRDFVIRHNLKNIHLLGSKSAEEVRSYMAHALATIVPSQCYEGFGLVVIESFSVGTPVIGSDIGNVNDLILDNHAGIVFKYNSSEDLYSKIIDFESHEDKMNEYRRNAEKAYLENYTPVKNYKKLLEIYDTVSQIKKPIYK